MANANKPPKGWLIAALICFLLGLAGCGGSVVIGITTVASLADDVANTTPMGQEITFEANTSGRAGVLLERTAVCSGTDDSGTNIEFDSFGGTNSVSTDNQEFNEILTFETDKGANYTLVCGADGQGSYTVLQLPALLSSGLGVALLAGGAFLGGFLLLLAVIFLIIGLVRRSSWKKRNQGPPPGVYGAPAGGAMPPPPGAPGAVGSAPGQAPPMAPPGQVPPVPPPAAPGSVPPPAPPQPGASPGWGEPTQPQPPQEPPSFGGGAPPPPPNQA